MGLENPKNIYIHMNYRDFYKSNNDWKRFKHLIPEGVDPKEFEMGFKDEFGEHPQAGPEGAAKIASQHLKKNPEYYSKMKKCGIAEKELIKGINLEDKACCDGLPKREDGALNIEHDGRPIKLAKIVQIGAIGGGMANGELSGYKNIGTTGEPRSSEKDQGGINADQEGDKEPITAGGEPVDPSLASKSVGGEVSPGEGQRQGGPNTKGNISGTPSLEGREEESGTMSLTLQEAKSKLRKMVKEALQEITYNRETGKWERLNEGHKAGCECGFCKNKGGFGKKKDKEDVDENVDMKMGPSYKVMPNPTLQTPGTQDLPRIQSYEPEITEMYDEEEECGMEERYTELATAHRNLSETELDELRDLGAKLERLDEAKKKKQWIQKATKGMRKDKPCTGKKFGGPTCPPGSKRYNLAKTFKKMAKKKDESVNMKMGPSYKADVQTYRCSDCDPARTLQYDPHMSECGYEEEQEEAGMTSEAGGAAVQHKSFRTAKDVTSYGKNRHKGDVDEGLKKKQ